MSDPENVERARRGEIPAPDPKSGPPLTEWNPEVAALADIGDLLRLLINAVLIGRVKKMPPLKFGDRPTTPVTQALRAAELAVAEAAFYDLVRDLTPQYAEQFAPPAPPH